MRESVPEPWELARLEYETAVEQYRHMSSLRRQDIAFVTTVQGAVFSVVGSKLLALDSAALCLSLIAVVVLLVGINSEWRLAAYMKAYMKRIREIEAEYGMSLLSLAGIELSKQRRLLSNSVVFPFYYIVFLLVWVSILILNLAD